MKDEEKMKLENRIRGMRGRIEATCRPAVVIGGRRYSASRKARRMGENARDLGREELTVQEVSTKQARRRPWLLTAVLLAIILIYVQQVAKGQVDGYMASDTRRAKVEKSVFVDIENINTEKTIKHVLKKCVFNKEKLRVVKTVKTRIMATWSIGESTD